MRAIMAASIAMKIPAGIGGDPMCCSTQRPRLSRVPYRPHHFCGCALGRRARRQDRARGGAG
jgi:hypothetical protein